MITDGKMQYLYDETGRRYLDVRVGDQWHRWKNAPHRHLPAS